MVSTTLQANNNEETDPYVIRRTWSSDDDDATMTGSNRETNEQELKEILVKWQLPGNLVLVDAKQLLSKLLAELLMSYPSEVQLIDAKQREWTYDPQIQEDRFSQEFEGVSIQLHPMRNKQQKLIKWVSITRFLTTKDLQDWKDNDYFYSQVLEAKAYMFPHPFKIDEWDISSIGFIRDTHVAHITADHLFTTLQNIIKKQEKESPLFQLIPQRITNHDKSATTRAYTVQCPKQDAKQLIHLLTHGDFRMQPMFIPFRYKTTQPEIFTRCIRQQNQVYHKTWVIKLEGLTEQAMDYIRSDIIQFQGVYQIAPTKRLSGKGEWKILVDHSKCSFVHKQITNIWRTLIDQIPDSIMTTMPVSFASPRVSSQKVRDYQDDSSDNDSYGSILTTGTENSTHNEEDEGYNEPPPQYSYPSYASAAAASTTSQGSTTVSSPTASAASELQKEKRDLEEQIRQQATRIQRIEADLEEKIIQGQDMAERLAQAIELAHTRDERHEELLQKFEQLMSRLNDSPPMITTHLPPPPPPYQKPEGTTQALYQATLPSRPMTDTSPPPKKSNTNTTPTKTMYPVFRQLEGLGTASHATTKTKRSQASLTKPTTTPEDCNEPTPGVQAGRPTT
jgi:hypothetical protein